MVFANLGAGEKDAFFSLLDEYFTSRPEIFNAQGGATAPGSTPGGSNPFRKEITGPQAQAAAAAVGRAGNAAAKFMSAGFKNAQTTVANSRTGGGGGGGVAHTSPPSTTSAGQHDGDSESHDTQSGGSLADRIASLQGKGGSIGSANATADRGGASSLTTARKFGDVDMSSGKNFINSIRNSSSNPPSRSSFQNTHSASAVDNIPSAFPPKNSANRFGPPPNRSGAPPAPPPRQPEPEPELEPEPEEEQGEWAEALYDFETSESGDLELKEGQRILVIERTSDDWWTGELDGKKGLFPASYVKLL